MKCALIIANEIKQIMLTPETEEEKAALGLITPNQDISVDIKRGTMFDQSPDSSAGYVVKTCRGEYSRAYEDDESVMLVLRPKKKASKPES